MFAGVAVRSGHHCTQPLHRELGINASARASLYIYSTKQDVDLFIAALRESIEFFQSMGIGVGADTEGSAVAESSTL